MEEKEITKKRNFFNVGLLVVLIASIGGLAWWQRGRILYSLGQVKSVFQTSREQWINVFVHGSFGSTLGLLDVSSVFRDQIGGSSYSKLSRAMRKKDVFFRDQIILEKGLVKIDPSFDFDIARRPYAAYPAAKAYAEVTNAVYPGKEDLHFYTFGWSGLMSQKKRRIEAVRLYNALAEEVLKFRSQGIEPKIRILSHSHGANVCLNLGGVSAALRGERIPEPKGYRLGQTVRNFKEIVSRSGSKEEASIRKGQKIWDYKPVVRDMHVDEFVMFGMPVQVETDVLVLSPFFKKSYHIYSDADMIQTMDWITTSKYASDRRFDRLQASCAESEIKLSDKFIQIRIMNGRKVDAEGFVTDPSGMLKSERTWWEVLVGRNEVEKEVQDPTHREMWFFVPQLLGDGSLVKPLPLAVYTPLLLNLASGRKDEWDFDINISRSSGNLRSDVMRHNEHYSLANRALPLSFVRVLQEKCKVWEPSASLINEYNKSVLACIDDVNSVSS
ncbi:hypothetical protein HOD08_02185 [bacterium]|mgnify:CR=1 FL=1|nr:hypothetical protein [bacterium]